MARMPGAIWKPLAANWASQPKIRAYDFFCVHTMVGSLVGTDGYFKVGNGTGYGGTESHFGVGPDGTIFQWQDTAYQADANGNGNWHVISSENADTGAPFPKWGGSDVPPLTPQQVEANAQIAAWLYKTHGIPLGIAGNSKPGSRGLSAHRYGVPGYAPAGAELWSSAQGKACPGDRRIAQLPAISARAKQLASGTAVKPAPAPAPVPEDDMPYTEAQLKEIVKDAVWEAPFDDAISGKKTQAWNMYRDMQARLGQLGGQNAALNATVKELSKAVVSLAANGDDIDEDALVARIDALITAAVSDAAKLVTVEVSVNDQPAA